MGPEPSSLVGTVDLLRRPKLADVAHAGDSPRHGSDLMAIWRIGVFPVLPGRGPARPINVGRAPGATRELPPAVAATTGHQNVVDATDAPGHGVAIARVTGITPGRGEVPEPP